MKDTASSTTPEACPHCRYGCLYAGSVCGCDCHKIVDNKPLTMQTYQTGEEIKDWIETCLDADAHGKWVRAPRFQVIEDVAELMAPRILSMLQAREEWLVSKVEKLETFREKYGDDSVGPQCVRLDQVLSLIKK